MEMEMEMEMKTARMREAIVPGRPRAGVAEVEAAVGAGAGGEEGEGDEGEVVPRRRQIPSMRGEGRRRTRRVGRTIIGEISGRERWLGPGLLGENKEKQKNWRGLLIMK